MKAGCISIPGLIFAISVVCFGQSPNYHQDIKPIIAKHCLPCHKPGNIGPMPLTSYPEAASYSAMMVYVTETGLMPPWKADKDYAHFRNERTLSQEEIRRIMDWVKIGVPEGQAVDTIELIKNQEEATSNFDYTTGMETAFEQYGIYYDQYQVFILPTNLDRDTFIREIQLQHGNASILKHCTVSIIDSGAADSLDNWDPRYGYYSFGGTGLVPLENAWFVWNPGDDTWIAPQGKAKFLPANSKLALYMYYGPTGAPQKDSTAIQFNFANGNDSRVHTLPLLNPYTISNKPFSIPGGVEKVFYTKTTLPTDMEVLSLFPQSNLLCQSWEVFARLPGNGGIIKLLKIPEWDFHWREAYRFREPIKLPAGTVLEALVKFDNTEDNPSIATLPPVKTDWGPGMFQEMMVLNAEFTISQNDSSQNIILLPANLGFEESEVKIRILQPGLYRLHLSDFSGQSAKTLLLEEVLESGVHSFSIDLSGYEPGNYLLTLSGGFNRENTYHPLVLWGQEKL